MSRKMRSSKMKRQSASIKLVTVMRTRILYMYEEVHLPALSATSGFPRSRVKRNEANPQTAISYGTQE